MEKVKVAIIGAGGIAEYHTRGLQLQQEVEITVVCDILSEVARKFADKYGVREITTDALSIVNRDEGVKNASPSA